MRMYIRQRIFNGRLWHVAYESAAEALLHWPCWSCCSSGRCTRTRSPRRSRSAQGEGSIKIRYGSLYTVIEGLQRESWIVVKETFVRAAGPSGRSTRSPLLARSGCGPGSATSREARQGIPAVRGGAVAPARRGPGRGGRAARRLVHGGSARRPRRCGPGSRWSRKSSSHCSWLRASTGSLWLRLSGSLLTTWSDGSEEDRCTREPGRVPRQTPAEP